MTDPPQQPDATPAARTAPGLHWGLKRSFLTYIARQPDGRCSVTDGADLDADGRFLFAFADPAAPGDRELRLCGELRFAAHHGMLFVRIAAPRLVVEDARGQLFAQVGLEEDAPHVVLATFAVPDRSVALSGPWTGTGLTLTDDGAEVFGGVYDVGEPLDDFIVVPAPAPPGTTDS